MVGRYRLVYCVDSLENKTPPIESCVTRARVCRAMDEKPTNSRQRIMDVAEELILQHGFAATSLKMIVEKAGLTKGSFFYHFDSKSDLAHQLIERFAESDRQFLEMMMGRAETVARKPRQQLLVFIGLMLEEFGPQGQPPEGCLFASYSYEAALFDAEIHEISRKFFLIWRRRLHDKLQEVAEEHPPRIDVDLQSLADMVSVTFEGGFVAARILDDPEVLVAQLVHLRNYFELLFDDGTT